jgi:mevalonate kinase
MTVTAWAPGRVNLIGDHTDHTGGLALPAALDRGTTVVGEEGGDVVVLTSVAFGGTAVVPVELGAADPSSYVGWARYVAAAVVEVQPANGFTGHVTSTLPIGAGLSSSASLELALAAALGADLEPARLAPMGQRIEHVASGVPCGILDQLAIASGVDGHALLLDCTTLDVIPVPVPDSIELVVVDSGERRALDSSAYGRRRDEAFAATEDAADPILRRRARHVRTENERVLAAVDALNDPRRFGLGARHITVSTSGVVPGIRRLTALGPQFTLAVSLHAARDPLRDVLVPLNRRWPVAEVVAAAREHAAATGRRVTYEATMIAGINDTEEDARAMAELLRGDHAHVNLIPMNPVAHTPWTASPDSSIERFAAILSAAGVTATIRRNRGQEIGAACGQLAAERAGEPAPAVVARRRERLVDESVHALRGERSDEPVPAGVGAGE